MSEPFTAPMSANATAPAEAGHAGEVKFRDYREGDIASCARLARDAWPAGPAAASKEIELAGMEGYMQYSLDSSNWAEVAFTPEGVVGFLFGRIENTTGRPAPARSFLGEIPSLARSVIEHDKSNPRLLAFVLSVALTEFKVRLNTPRSDASVEMFIVHSGWRGKGVGSELLDRFLEAAMTAGSRVVTVYTDELMSNWRFYENRGFKRVATFHDNITSHYSGRDARGIILALDCLRPDSEGIGPTRPSEGRGM